MRLSGAPSQPQVQVFGQRGGQVVYRGCAAHAGADAAGRRRCSQDNVLTTVMEPTPPKYKPDQDAT